MPLGHAEVDIGVSHEMSDVLNDGAGSRISEGSPLNTLKNKGGLGEKDLPEFRGFVTVCYFRLLSGVDFTVLLQIKTGSIMGL